MIQDLVREFHETYGVPVAESPGVPPTDRVKLRLELILEEVHELMAACGLDIDWQIASIRYYLKESGNLSVHLPSVADALTDIAYVVEGAALEFGLDSQACLKEVHRSNMSKLGEDGKPIYRADGKVLKGPSFTPPDFGL